MVSFRLAASFLKKSRAWHYFHCAEFQAWLIIPQ